MMPPWPRPVLLAVDNSRRNRHDHLLPARARAHTLAYDEFARSLPTLNGIWRDGPANVLPRQGSSACCCILTRRAARETHRIPRSRFGLVYDLLCCRGNNGRRLLFTHVQVWQCCEVWRLPTKSLPRVGPTHRRVPQPGRARNRQGAPPSWLMSDSQGRRW